MPVEIWILSIIFCVLSMVLGIIITFVVDSKFKKWVSVGAAIIISILIIVSNLYFYNSTASGKRAMLDQRINFENGINRVVTVYTADGKVIAQYKGKIDIEENDGGYVKFDLNGKRYIYYNCFVESIADIPEQS